MSSSRRSEIGNSYGKRLNRDAGGAFARRKREIGDVRCGRRLSGAVEVRVTSLGEALRVRFGRLNRYIRQTLARSHSVFHRYCFGGRLGVFDRRFFFHRYSSEGAGRVEVEV